MIDARHPDDGGPADPAFGDPSKFVGPVYSRESGRVPSAERLVMKLTVTSTSRRGITPPVADPRDKPIVWLFARAVS